LSDHGVLLWAVKAILKSLSSLKDSNIIDEWAAHPVVRSPQPYLYCLSQRAVDELAFCKPLSNETLSAYLHLLATQRCFSKVLEDDQLKFHLFDGLFFTML